jgi:hypothetical protein
MSFEAVWGQRGQSEALHSLLNRVAADETKNSIL